MIRLLIFSLSLTLTLSLTLSSPSAADARGLREVLTLCETYLPHMREVMATLKQHTPLTEGQNALWRVWNRDCKHASWQQALAEGLPPVAPGQDFTVRDPQPVPPPARTWRHDAVDVLQALERGLTAPMYGCNTQTYVVKGQVRSYGFCGPR